MNATEIKAMWVYASQMWSNHPIPADADERVVLLQIWSDTLGDLDAVAVRAALVAMSASEWFPPLGALRARACELVAQAAGVDRLPDEDEAWSEVMVMIGRVGRYGMPDWSHPTVGSTVAAIGWQEICGCTELGVMRGQFRRMFTAAQGRALQARTPPPPALAAFLADAAKAVGRVDDVLELGGGS